MGKHPVRPQRHLRRRRPILAHNAASRPAPSSSNESPNRLVGLPAGGPDRSCLRPNPLKPPIWPPPDPVVLSPAMRIEDHHLLRLRDHGYAFVLNFLSEDELRVAREGLWEEFPKPETYFVNKGAFRWLERSENAGLALFPSKSWALNRLAFHPDLVDGAERYLGTTDIELYKAEVWAKYAGAFDYEQPHHRDYTNHSLVVPRADGRFSQLTTILFLSNISESDAPTAVVPLDASRDVPLVPAYKEKGDLVDREEQVTGPAGSLLLFRTDVLHRATSFTGPGRARFVLLADYQARGAGWGGKVAWPNRGWNPAMGTVMTRASVRERDLFGWPPPGHPYWNEQTRHDVAARYPGIDMGPYHGS